MFYDPVERHLAVEKMVTRKVSERLEQGCCRVRLARWYGRVVTADYVGCGLFCKFCWTPDNVMFHPAEAGRFCTPSELAGSWISLAKKRNMNLLRISGGETTIGKKHLLQFLTLFKAKDTSSFLKPTEYR